jgi:hypothetical protein
VRHRRRGGGLADDELDGQDLGPGRGPRVGQALEQQLDAGLVHGDALGIRLKPEVLPLSNLAGYLPPFWVSPQLAMRRRFCLARSAGGGAVSSGWPAWGSGRRRRW